jgi:hypothetical protein
MQSVLSFAISIYLTVYTFESAIRYGFHLLGADELIFLRDALLIVPLVVIFIQQFLGRRLHPAFIMFIFIILLHGLVMMLNLGSFIAVVYGTKMLMTVLAGAVGGQLLFRPNRPMLMLVVLLWSVSWVGVVLDKYYVEFPWAAMETTIGDLQVDISRDWQMEGESKRAGGFTRSSINVATLEPLLALILLFNLRSLPLRIAVAVLTIPALVWTTQKGAIVAYLLTLGFIAMSPKKPIAMLRIGFWLMLTLAVALPVIMPGYTMPSVQSEVVSASSFYQRVEEMWPQAWRWIDHHDAFPFGVGLGGIGGAQRLYANDELNAADNIFILMYAYFGMMSVVYLGGIAAIAMRIRNDSATMAAHAMATLVFLLGYGCVISLLEDQIASLFLGASLACLCHEIRQRVNPVPPLKWSRQGLTEGADRGVGGGVIRKPPPRAKRRALRSVSATPPY